LEGKIFEIILLTSFDVSGVCSLGFNTTVLPQEKADKTGRIAN